MIVNFLGHLHPVFVHLPIGFLVLAYLVQYLAKSHAGKSLLMDFILSAGVLSSVAAAFFGWMLSLSGGYEEKLLDWHRYSAILVCIFSIWLLAYKRYKKTAYATPIYHLGFQGMMLVLLAAGHFGGEMTHGEGYLFSSGTGVSATSVSDKGRPIPQPLTASSNISVYAGIVEPVLAQKCMQCHNEKKKKGDFQMHNFEALMRGGKNGEVLVPGDLEHSAIIQRILLDKGDEKHMPPVGKSQLTKPEQDLLSWWVSHGISATQQIKEVGTNDTIRQFLSDNGKPSLGKAALPTIEPADAARINEIKKLNVAIVPVAMGTNFMEVNMVNVPSFGNKEVLLLKAIAPQIMWLVMADTKITDEGLEQLKWCTNTTRLNLKNTAITDTSVSHIGAMLQLEYLNIVGTKITDDGLLGLNPGNNLKKIYCWNTAISEQGVMAFQKKYPTIEIDFGEKK